MRQWVARTILKLLGWKIDTYEFDHIKKGVLTIAPHTSNWDWLYWILLAFTTGKPFRYLLKDTLYYRFRPLMKATGAIPTKKGEGMVEGVVEKIKETDSIFLVLSPEGVLPRTEYWRTGFYRIATMADVPIAPVYIDYETKTLGYGEFMYPTGDIEKDIKFFADFYKDFTPRHPEQFGPVRVKSEA